LKLREAGVQAHTLQLPRPPLSQPVREKFFIKNPKELEKDTSDMLQDYD
jgi:hypothetical protein